MAENVVRLDVREDILKGREPFTRIMAAVQGLAGGDQLLLIVPFEPVPLYHVLKKKGFSSSAQRNEKGDWEVLFTKNQAIPAVTNPKREVASTSSESACEVDARGLEPPQPLVTILEALQNLPKGAQLRARTDRRPLHLYAQLEERGFFGETTEQVDGSFLTTISEMSAAQETRK